MPPPNRLLLSALALPPGAALLLTTYLHNHPLPSSYSRRIKALNILSPASHASHSNAILNPRSHQRITDTRFILLHPHEVSTLSDEAILARFTKGFLGRWVFFPERCVMGLWEAFGARVVETGFTGEFSDLDMTNWS